MSYRTNRKLPKRQPTNHHPIISKRRQELIKPSSSTILHPIEQVMLLINSARSKATSRGLSYSLDTDYMLGLAEENYCPLTGTEFDDRQGGWLPKRRSLDRIDNSIGYENDNVRIVSKWANVAKSVWDDQTFDEMCCARAEMLGWTAPTEENER